MTALSRLPPLVSARCFDQYQRYGKKRKMSGENLPTVVTNSLNLSIAAVWWDAGDIAGGGRGVCKYNILQQAPMFIWVLENPRQEDPTCTHKTLSPIWALTGFPSLYPTGQTSRCSAVTTDLWSASWCNHFAGKGPFLKLVCWSNSRGGYLPCQEERKRTAFGVPPGWYCQRMSAGCMQSLAFSSEERFGDFLENRKT